jgi:uncharacterized protein (DUF952 family)
VNFHHLALASDWETAVETGEYLVSTRGRTIAEVGYMHGSYPDQVLPVAEAYYADLDVPLVLLEIDAARLGDLVRVEEVPGADKPFPHLYGPLPVEAVVAVRAFERDPVSGRFVLPDGVG